MATNVHSRTRHDGAASSSEFIRRRRQPQHQTHPRGVWNSRVNLAVFVVFVLSLAVAPSTVQSLHGKGDGYTGTWSMDAAQVNATAKYSRAWRTGFHFQPRKNWMNDPNGPMYYKGYYHLFYQYDPFSALWGNITWGHAVSTDLIHWKYLDDAAIKGGPDWYDVRGAWSGSTTFLADGTPAMLYTGWSNLSDTFQIQTQNLVYPVNASDPLLRYWYKYENNPVIVAELSMNASNYRDPTEAWKGNDGGWRILIGSKQADQAGTAFVYSSKDFENWTYLHELHAVPGTGMWECPDFFPVSLSGKKGLDVSVLNGSVKHVVKVSLDNTKKDAYAVGTYNQTSETFQADNETLDVGIGLVYDSGKFYASKTFFDNTTSRRILWGWINESTADQNAIISGWSGLQGIPRQVWLDPETKASVIQSPIEEVDRLHLDKSSMTEFNLSAGSLVPIAGIYGPQLDIQVEFYKPKIFDTESDFDGSTIAAKSAQEVCSGSGGGAISGYYGPFGLLVLADKALEEETAVFFYLAPVAGKWKALLCSDQSRSSLQIGVDETMYGTYVHVLETDEYLSLRTLVDHSIVESFAQRGRSVITSRVYPTVAVNDAAQAYVYNNGTVDIQVHSLTAWRMASIDIVQFGS